MAHLIHVSYFPTICTIKKKSFTCHVWGERAHLCFMIDVIMSGSVFNSSLSLLQPAGRKLSGRKNRRGLIYKPIHGFHKEIKEKEKRVDFHLHRPRWSCREPANPCSQRWMINDGPAESVTTHINQLIVLVFMQATRKIPEISSHTCFWKHSGLIWWRWADVG